MPWKDPEAETNNQALRGTSLALSGFKNFIIMRGNLVRLVVAVVTGTQFSELVKQFVLSFVNPLLSARPPSPTVCSRPTSCRS